MVSACSGVRARARNRSSSRHRAVRPASSKIYPLILLSLRRELGMSRVATAWRWLLAKVRDRRTQLRLCLRVTVAALASFVLAQLFTIPLAGLWAVLTAVVVTQMSLGGSLKATIEYSVGTLGGAVYAGTIATLVPHYDEISLLAVLALAVAPLALLAAVDPHFRVGPYGRHCGSRGVGHPHRPDRLGVLSRARGRARRCHRPHGLLSGAAGACARLGDRRRR